MIDEKSKIRKLQIINPFMFSYIVFNSIHRLSLLQYRRDSYEVCLTHNLFKDKEKLVKKHKLFLYFLI